jgi:hypothetical protein
LLPVTAFGQAVIIMMLDEEGGGAATELELGTAMLDEDEEGGGTELELGATGATEELLCLALDKGSLSELELDFPT